MLTYLKLMFEMFLKDEEGATAIEYGIIAAVLAVVLVTAFTLLGGDLETFFDTVLDDVQTDAEGA